MTLLACALGAPSVYAQHPAPGLQPHVDLSDSLNAADTLKNSGVKAAFIPSEPAVNPSDKLFDDPPPPEGGWKGLAKLLEALAPSVDTAIPLTPSQITDRISRMLDQGRNQEALDIIEKRQAQRDAGPSIGTDVQLLFLRGRALAALGRTNEAIDLYQSMTVEYPELPEPWNNLAAEYVKQGKIDMAHDALAMALTANPNYAAAKANMGRVQLMLAQRSFKEAAAQGVSGAATQAQQTLEVLEN